MIHFIFLLFFQTTDPSKLLNQAKEELSSGKRSMSEILQDDQYMKLHSLEAFRQIIKSNAKTGVLNIVQPGEPGTPAEIWGKITGSKDPSSLLVYVYQTDNRGLYADTSAQVKRLGINSNLARLFAYLKPDKNGAFGFHSIHPKRYPNSNANEHIHIEIYDAGGSRLMESEFLFEDDALMNNKRKTEAVNYGMMVSKNEGSSNKKKYNYVINLR